ncbi:DedA family protein [Aeromonas salmonicida]|nr:DedA family protein [Aeromonas salmonicida]
MEQFYQLAHAFMHQDLVTLSDPKRPLWSVACY